MEYTVRIHEHNKIKEIKANRGTNLLKLLRSHSIDLKSPCGGKGSCGKCRVIVQGLIKNPSVKEKDLLGEKAVLKGFRLACYNNITSNVDVYLNKINEEASIVTSGKEIDIKIEPIVSKEMVELPIPTIHDQMSDIERVAKYCSKKSKLNNSLDFLRELPSTIRNDNFKVTLAFLDKKLFSVEAGDTTNKLYGIAVDIGTTTIAAYLVELASGRKLDVYSALNPQRKFGADVISRIEYTMASEESRSEMNEVIVSSINQAIEYFSSNNGISFKHIYAAVFVGNTTMMHFLMNLPANNIASSPFIPVSTALHKLPAKEIGIKINPNGYAIIFPAVSGYIGADTVAAVLSSGMHTKEKVSLLIDIGTNGEIVLGNKKTMYACSAAAGPAFEGANIRNGVGGVKGAIERIVFTPSFEYNTIGNEKAIGICGSGIVDAIAGMLQTGIIDETGKIVDAEESPNLPVQIKDRFTEIDGKKSFMLLKSEECASEIDIAITQKDVRELQNAKAAIAAGINILIKQAQVSVNDIDRVYLAGGFGSYINIESAFKIGLLPKALVGKVESIGNAAGTGAITGLISSKMLKKAEKIKENVKYIELSSYSGFMDEYVECMMFD